MLRRITGILLGCLAVATASAGADSDAYAAARAEFRAAMSVVGTTMPEAAPLDSEALRSYPLYPYLQAARLARQLTLLPAPSPGDSPAAPLPVDSAVETFLAQVGDQPVARALRRDWLESLGARRAWGPFAAAFTVERDGGDAQLRCAWYEARIALGRVAGLASAVTETWLTGKSLPERCNAAFDWLRARGGLGHELVEQRARLALRAGDAALARHLARSLPPRTAAPILRWASLVEAPKSALTALIEVPEREVEAAALLDGWQRYARSDADAAAALYPSLVAARKFDARGASPYALAVGLAQAWSRRPRALEFFAKVEPGDFDERGYEWRVRAALWAGDWAQARTALEAMPEALRRHNRWRYWAARAAERLGDATAAREGYAAVVPTDNWYAVHAAARLGQPYTPDLERLALDEPQLVLLGTQPGFVRARELLSCDLENEAGSEWAAAFESLTAAQRVQAVGLAARWGWHIQAIAAAAKQGLFNDYDTLYPRPYEADVRKAAARTGLPSELIYAIIRQESLYRASAGSSAGALGLMQLLPSTARRTANKADLPIPTRDSLLLPAVNIPLGSAYLKSLIDRAAGQVPLAVAGYNAGPAAARRWLPTAPMDTDIWTENIPYNETRVYVQRVSWHALVFAWLADRKPRDVANWLTTTQAPAVDAALTSTDTP